MKQNKILKIKNSLTVKRLYEKIIGKSVHEENDNDFINNIFTILNYIIKNNKSDILYFETVETKLTYTVKIKDYTASYGGNDYIMEGKTFYKNKLNEYKYDYIKFILPFLWYIPIDDNNMIDIKKFVMRDLNFKKIL